MFQMAIMWLQFCTDELKSDFFKGMVTTMHICMRSTCTFTFTLKPLAIYLYRLTHTMYLLRQKAFFNDTYNRGAKSVRDMILINLFLSFLHISTIFFDQNRASRRSFICPDVFFYISALLRNIRLCLDKGWYMVSSPHQALSPASLALKVKKGILGVFCTEFFTN